MPRERNINEADLSRIRPACLAARPWAGRGDVSVAPIELSQSNSKLEKEVAELRQSKKE